jgi:hypothetical protein
MRPVSRIVTFAAASILAVLTTASLPSHAKDPAQSPSTVWRHAYTFADCHALKRAISRRACQARLMREMEVDTAQKK